MKAFTPCLMVLLTLLMLAPFPCQAKPGPLVVILLPGTGLRDWQGADAPTLHLLMASGALAVMNTRTARLPDDKRREAPESALLTLGAGARAASGKPGTLGYDIHLGNLADTLAKASIPIRAGGGRYARLLAADGRGQVLSALSLDNLSDGCTIWDAGSDVKIAERVIANVLPQVTARNGRLYVVSPFAGDQDYRAGRRLTPVLEFGEGIPAGLLVSPSTRRPGLVTNTDFAPSIAAYFGCKREDFPALPFGADWSAMPSRNALRQVSSLEEKAYRQGRGQRILPYLAVALAVWIGIGTLRRCRAALPAWAVALPLTAAFALLPAGSATEAVVWFAALTLVSGGLILHSKFQPVGAALAAGIVVVLCVDMITGSHLMHRSLLGYSAVEGARYYGIGNEAMGLLVGSALAAASSMWPLGKWWRTATVAALILLTLLLGSPQAGAKAGGLLVASAAFGVFIWMSRGGAWSWRVYLLLGAGTACLLGIVSAGDAFLFPGHLSHLGEAVRRVRSGGAGEAWDIISRKGAVEGRLAWHSAWAALLWTGLSCLWYIQRTATHHHNNPCEPNNGLSKTGFTAGFVALAACLLLNDAGVVAAALCAVPLWSVAAPIPKKVLGEVSSPRTVGISI